MSGIEPKTWGIPGNTLPSLRLLLWKGGLPCIGSCYSLTVKFDLQLGSCEGRTMSASLARAFLRYQVHSVTSYVYHVSSIPLQEAHSSIVKCLSCFKKEMYVYLCLFVWVYATYVGVPVEVRKGCLMPRSYRWLGVKGNECRSSIAESTLGSWAISSVP